MEDSQDSQARIWLRGAKGLEETHTVEGHRARGQEEPGGQGVGVETGGYEDDSVGHAHRHNGTGTSLAGWLFC